MAPRPLRGPGLDVSALPTYRFSHHSLVWWGTLWLMAIESTVFGLVVMAYFYLRAHSPTWPISALPPDLVWGTLYTVLLLVSVVPAHLASKAGEAHDLAKVRLWLGVTFAFTLVLLVLRGLEFTTLNVRWDSSAYGSVVWLLLGLHTTHLITDAIDTGVLVALFARGPLDGKRFLDVSENSFYWYFVVASWLPIYGVLYWGARPLGAP